MSESGVAIQPPTQETVEPVKNLTEKLDWFFLAVKNITHPSKFRALDHRIERPLSQRQQRATSLREFLAIPKDNREARKQVLTEAHLRDELTRQYLNQGEVSVTFPIMGTQKARYATIQPPESLQNELSERPPIILIPGISATPGINPSLVLPQIFQRQR